MTSLSFQSILSRLRLVRVAALIAISTISLLAAATADAKCPDITFIGAAGSGQRDSKSAIEKHNGVGPEVDEMARVMEKDLKAAHLSFGLYPVEYPAKSTSSLKPTRKQLVGLATDNAAIVTAALASYTLNVRGYFASIDEGAFAAALQARLINFVCQGTTRFVFAGYSQGAMAVHRAERVLVNLGDLSTVSKIAGTILLADGDRISHTDARGFGSSDNRGQGVESYLKIQNQEVILPGSTASICDHHDIVCDFGIGTVLDAVQASRIHTHYSNDPIDRATDWVAERVVESSTTLVRKVSPLGSNFHLRNDLRVGKSLRADCSPGSGVISAAYRCFSAHYVLDPCYPGRNGQGFVRFYCLLHPWDQTVTELFVRDFQVLPDGVQPERQRPWALRTLDGDKCIFSSGSHDVVNGVPVWWGCDHNFALLGDLDRSQNSWQATLVQFHPDGGYYSILGSRKITTAWFGERARTP